MKKTNLLFALSLLIYSICFAQQPNQIEVSKRYNDYFKQESENIFTQLNKTNYTANESIWFTSYVYYNFTLNPYLSTTNIYTNVYNSSGEMIDQKIFKCRDGYMQGQLTIDEKYTPGVYYIKTTTNWMRNFDTDLSDLKQFVVDSEIKTKPTKIKYNFDIVPEGGTLVSNIINTVGVKLNTALESVNLKGIVTDENNNIITLFKFNDFGIGKFSAKLSSNNQYKVTIYDNDVEKFSKPINNIKDTGLHLNLINKTESVVLKLTTNPETLKGLIEKEYYLYLHRDGIINSIPIAFESNKTSYSIQINKTDLPKGITILSLLNKQNEPILERMYFNDLSYSIGELEVQNINKGNDSTTLTLKTTIKGNTKNSFSVSVLPENSNIYGLKENIKTKLILFPYLNQSIINEKEYLKDTSRKSLYDLDLLLLTQGKSKQSLLKIINTKIVVRHNFDTGFKIKGKLNNTKYKKGNYIELVSPNNGLKAESVLTTENEFSLDNLYLGNDTEINFLLKNKRGKSLKVKPYYNLFPKPFVESIAIEKLKDPTEEISPIKINKNFIINDDVVKLNEVELGEVTKKKEEKNTPLGASFATRIVFEEDADQFQLITDVIRGRGFTVTNNGFDVTIVSNRAKTISSGSLTPAVYFDNMPINNDLSQLANLVVNEVEELYISHNGSILGSAGAGGVINIFSKRGSVNLVKDLHRTFEVTNGFTDSLDYKSPFYASMYSELFSMYGVLNWTPSIKANKNGIIIIKVPNYYKDKAQLIVNGMDENGVLYSLEKTINLDSATK
ncbi:hypothetical protein [uncultured Lacinutrix sp.]|uniref:hypothetical protein n=1 Tax=uncultured Lacinutrix sp. TaxID=574032 RepID=UPI00262ED4D0|nr:hypothetical protein [uncultured Lacinutrix sp.]